LVDMRRELSGVMSEGWRSQRRPGQGSSFIRSLTSPRGSEKLFCTEESHTSPAGRKSRVAWLEVRRRDNARGVRAFACCFLGFSASNRVGIAVSIERVCLRVCQCIETSLSRSSDGQEHGSGDVGSRGESKKCPRRRKRPTGRGFAGTRSSAQKPTSISFLQPLESSRRQAIDRLPGWISYHVSGPKGRFCALGSSSLHPHPWTLRLLDATLLL
jgi:hypothetical protein